MSNCVATIFMGDLRVSTNVMKKEGGRAVGTRLQGKAHEALFTAKGSFTGEAKILDEPYFTLYEPIKNPGGEVVGALFVGVKKADYLKSFNQLTLFSIIIGILLAIVSSAFVWMVCKNAVKPLSGMVGVMQKAAGGDLSVRLSIAGKDEFGQLATAFNNMMNDINNAMRKFFSVADLVRDSVAMVSATTDSMASAAEEVAVQANTIATASEEMSATSSDIARNCLYAAENAEQGRQQTNNGAELVQRSARLMEKIAQRVNESAGTIGGLGERSDQIGAIVNTIQDIADQTNLLALNAAIEAARAGEQGRGFAVVADEVRALAERTTKATKEIDSMIKTIQSETQLAVSSMSEGVEDVRLGTVEAVRSGEALEEILAKINELTMQVSQIATAAEEQTATTTEITSNIQSITDVVDRNLQSARSTTEASTKLSDQVDEMHTLVSRFKLSAALEWDPSFATGVERFDETHKTLFRMVNDLHSAMQGKRSKEAIGTILDGLADYTVKHFADEEQSFARTRYPDEAAHKELHRKLIEQVVALQGKFRTGETILTQDVITFLQDWLVNHIKGADKRYGPHLNRYGIR
jgi:methyl-accepting chemotaxis protein/hemerythrin